MPAQPYRHGGEPAHSGVPQSLADGLAWPEGPAVLADGSIAFVETYRSALSCWTAAAGVQPLAMTGGGPNACALGSDGCLYLTQNGGIVGPWRAAQQCPPGIQRVTSSGSVQTVATEVSGHRLRAPNDLAFGPDGVLYFTDPGGPYDPENRADPGAICGLWPDGQARILHKTGNTYPNGIIAERDGSIVWAESYTRAVRRRTPDGHVALIGVLPGGSIPDGLAAATSGDLYITATKAARVDIITRTGEYQGSIPVSGVPTNCTFHGSALFITDGGHLGLSGSAAAAGRLWRVDLPGVHGAEVYAGNVHGPG